MKYAEALANYEHLKSLDQTTVYLYDRENPYIPYEKAERVEAGGAFRFSGPSCIYLVWEEHGLTFKANVDFEQRDASGRSVSLFDRARLRELALRLNPTARHAFAQFLRTEVLPDLEKRTEEQRAYLAQQWDSEDCVRGLIAFGQR